MTVIAQAYVEGVWTHRVDDLAKAMGIVGISSSEVSRVASELDGRVTEFRDRRLDTGPYRYVWIDAVARPVRRAGRRNPPAERLTRALRLDPYIVGAFTRSAIGTLVERTSRFPILMHLDGASRAESLRNQLQVIFEDLPEPLRRSLSWDQGSEMCHHHSITAATRMPVYFCHPGRPWQRPSNENSNGLLRDYCPKATDLRVHAAADLERVAEELNRRPARPSDGAPQTRSSLPSERSPRSVYCWNPPSNSEELQTSVVNDGHRAIVYTIERPATAQPSRSSVCGQPIAPANSEVDVVVWIGDEVDVGRDLQSEEDVFWRTSSADLAVVVRRCVSKLTEAVDRGSDACAHAGARG